MKLCDMLNTVQVEELIGDPGTEISSIAYDSRRVTPGALFVALPGTSLDGADYMEDAIRRGAAAVLTQGYCALGGRFPCIRVADARMAMAQMACAFYGEPSSRLCTVGITGTNGKTTVSFMISEILRAAGRRPGLIGTVRYEIGERVLPAARTTPESPDIQSMLAQMERARCDSVVMEVSSHALDQHRVRGILFDAAVFTNLTQDHLDYHGSLEEYFRVKSTLFNQLRGKALVNLDDPWGRRLLEKMSFVSGGLSFGFDDAADIRGCQPVATPEGSRMTVESPWGRAEVSLRLIGRFNLSNALAALAVAGSLGIGLDTAAGALASMPQVPGRLEAIPNRRGRRVFVDYAHTDDALRNVLAALRAVTPGRLIVVFGCGGNRDTGKRRLMGEVASRMADYSILTNDNPRFEIPEKIAADIAAGFDSERKYEICLDRKAAIQRGVELLGRKDTLLIAGKGHEACQEVAGSMFPFDDREVAGEVLS